MARILIVEDDPVNIELAVLTCKAAHHLVTVVGNGVEALLVLDALPFDLILTAVTLPKMDGLAMTSLIRGSSASYANIPIVGLATKALPSAVADMLDTGLDEVLTKPLRMSTLGQAIDTGLSHGSRAVAIFRIPDERAQDRLDA